MLKQRNAGTSLFLMEMIIIILFFSVAGAVCIQSFVNAHLLDRHTMELNHAVIAAQGFADVMRGTDGSLESLTAAFPEAIPTGKDALQAYYDKDFRPLTDQDQAAYQADVTLTPDGKLQRLSVTVTALEDGTEIYSLQASKFMK